MTRFERCFVAHLLPFLTAKPKLQYFQKEVKVIYCAQVGESVISCETVIPLSSTNVVDNECNMFKMNGLIFHIIA